MRDSASRDCASHVLANCGGRAGAAADTPELFHVQLSRKRTTIHAGVARDPDASWQSAAACYVLREDAGAVVARVHPMGLAL